jgi:uncharacterized membrane protein YciS (DUF1049 family)
MTQLVIVFTTAAFKNLSIRANFIKSNGQYAISQTVTILFSKDWIFARQLIHRSTIFSTALYVCIYTNLCHKRLSISFIQMYFNQHNEVEMLKKCWF